MSRGQSPVLAIIDEFVDGLAAAAKLAKAPRNGLATANDWHRQWVASRGAVQPPASWFTQEMIENAWQEDVLNPLVGFGTAYPGASPQLSEFGISDDDARWLAAEHHDEFSVETKFLREGSPVAQLYGDRRLALALLSKKRTAERRANQLAQVRVKPGVRSRKGGLAG